MELRSFVQWCVNQYLDLIQIFEQALYKKESNFQPNLVDGKRLQKLIYLTRLYNSDERELGDKQNDILLDIGRILDSLYENIYGYWDGAYSVHMNLWKYSIDVDYGYNCFFFQLLIAELFLKYSGEKEKVKQIESHLIDFPIEYETQPENINLNDYQPCLPGVENAVEYFSNLLRDNMHIFNISNRACWRLDTLGICSFYKKYFTMKYIGKRKDILYGLNLNGEMSEP